jgi:hypothetical protein
MLHVYFRVGFPVPACLEISSLCSWIPCPPLTLAFFTHSRRGDPLSLSPSKTFHPTSIASLPPSLPLALPLHKGNASGTDPAFRTAGLGGLFGDRGPSSPPSPPPSVLSPLPLTSTEPGVSQVRDRVNLLSFPPSSPPRLMPAEACRLRPGSPSPTTAPFPFPLPSCGAIRATLCPPPVESPPSSSLATPELALFFRVLLPFKLVFSGDARAFFSAKRRSRSLARSFRSRSSLACSKT